MQSDRASRTRRHRCRHHCTPTSCSASQQRQLLDVLREQYVELTLEFFSTFRLRRGDLTAATAIEFIIGSALHHMSISQFASRIGLYTEAEVSLPIFTDSLRTVTTREAAYGITQSQLMEWWPTIADGV
ncbi:hypothetical protein L1987_43385 [Smallanthus sonchifolius]|uniref:Uncharacterized protein n=1 Tax=Smallanthus sonchifolius TaxID=185202 RepID=A0ACB9GM90_9ASTR|nr:hypothetical protein L1987_43385 [Smallanthus sonchifolius]